MLQLKPQRVVQTLVWDAFNVVHIQKHGVSVQEVEDVFQSDVCTLAGHDGRLLVLGTTKDSRYLTVVLDSITDESAYVVTARPMSGKERLYLTSVKNGGR